MVRSTAEPVHSAAASADSWDGHDLLAAVRHAAATLRLHVEEVNALNVFPVPDGDTGSNMVATIQAAVDEADQIPEADRTVGGVSAALSLGALMGARGNSGVILSQIIRGMGVAVVNLDRIGGLDLARAFEEGCRAAFAAVAHPVEGTILTVARDVATTAARLAHPGVRLEQVLAASVAEAGRSVARTPTLLAVLHEAGVVDAGGKGLELLLRGALAASRGEQIPDITHQAPDLHFPTFESETDGFGYETVFVVTPDDGVPLDTAQIRSRLDQIGESVLVAGDDRAVKIHVHNTRPDEVIAYGLSLGSLSRISIENLDRQTANVRDRATTSVTKREPGDKPTATARGVRVVAVVSGDGLARVFRALGASAVVQGGQGANPSAGELAEAIRATGSDEVIILANNPNVPMAARLAGDLFAEVRVRIIATRNAAEGVAAMLAMNEAADLDQATREMIAAAARVQTLQVTMAVRTARIDRRKVLHGECIVLGPDDGLVAADKDRTAAVLAAVANLKDGFELITLYRGKGIEQAAAEQLRAALLEQHPHAEVELVDGGQPHYDFLISAE